MKIVCISDTHEKHKRINLPRGDVLIHAGDFTWVGKEKPILEFLDWFESLEIGGYITYIEAQKEKLSVPRITFENYLKDYTPDLLNYARKCKGLEGCNSIKDFVNYVVQFRHDFVHSLSTKQILPWDKNIEVDNDGNIPPGAKVFDVLSMPFLTRLIRIGIFTKFDYMGTM